jgi:hypothetical protein
MPDNHPQDQDEALEAPAKLVAALKRLPQDRVFVPPTVDEAVLRTARQRLDSPRRTWPGWWRFMPWAAAAAVLVLLATVPHFSRWPAHGPAREPAFARWKLNREGDLDILDALVLARQLKQGGTTDLQWDVNGDGVVDERDVSAIAARAVRLEAGS